MERGNIVHHLRHPHIPLKVVSPPQNNGFEYMICEVFDPRKLCWYVITDKPEFFF